MIEIMDNKNDLKQYWYLTLLTLIFLEVENQLVSSAKPVADRLDGFQNASRA